MPTYRRQPVAFVRGEGAALFDADDRRYVDCMAGISMSNVGHCHPKVVRAITEQAERLINVSNLYYTEPMVTLAEWIRDRSLGGRVFFCNSGAEASEAALKLARKAGGPGRTEVVALVEGFHGRTFGALSLTGQPSKQEPFQPLVPGVTHVERTDLEGMSAAVGPRTCAIVLEVVQGEVGVQPVPARDAPPGARARGPSRRPADHRRDPDRPLAHRAAVGPRGRGRGARRDVPGQEPRRRRPDRGDRGATRVRLRAAARRPRLDLRRQPARLRGGARVLRGARRRRRSRTACAARARPCCRASRAW